MRERVRFVLVTDDIDFALAAVFAAARSNAPGWARVTDDPAEILALPDGCRVHPAIWRSRHMASGAEIAWRERRARGGLDFLRDEEMDKVAAWRARRAGGTSALPEAAPSAPVPAARAPSLPILQQWT